MTDLVRTIREALELHREYAGDPSVSWNDETVTQWLSEAADEIGRLTKAIQDVVDDLDSNDSEVYSRERFGTEPKVIVGLRNVLPPKETL